MENAGLDGAWDVLLVGGPSGCGKSSLAYPLAKTLDLSLTEADDLCIAAKALSSPATQPALHFFTDNPEATNQLTAEQILEAFLGTCRAMSPALKSVVQNHLETDRPFLLEGDYLLPELMLEIAAEMEDGNRVRAVYVIEEDEQQIVANYLTREPELGEQRKRARVSWLFGQWLLAECERLELAAIAARPWSTLSVRVLDALQAS